MHDVQVDNLRYSPMVMTRRGDHAGLDQEPDLWQPLASCPASILQLSLHEKLSVAVQICQAVMSIHTAVMFIHTANPPLAHLVRLVRFCIITIAQGRGRKLKSSRYPELAAVLEYALKFWST